MPNRFFEYARKEMVDLLKERHITDTRVLNALSKIPRHFFVPLELRKMAYADTALKIGQGQTISQPYIVAVMTQAAKLNETSNVLEIGTGSGYQAAVLAEICQRVYTVEIIEELARQSAALLHHLGYLNLFHKIADGHEGWPEYAPFDAIIVTAAAPEIPFNLITQLKVGGRLIIPIGDPNSRQILMRIIRTTDDRQYIQQKLLEVQFVPLVSHP